MSELVPIRVRSPNKPLLPTPLGGAAERQSVSRCEVLVGK